MRFITLGYLLALVIFIVAGTSIASFHGDEAMQIYMSSDYATAFIDRAPDRLLSYPPFDIDSDHHLRLINGSVNRYLIGLSWHLAGYTRDSLPPRPGWDWGLNYTDNVNTGHRPDAAFMLVSRLSSALLTALGAVLMFAISGRLGGAPVAYLSSFLYAVHPVILLNGRRAMQEGSMFAFGLLTIYAAVLIASTVLEGVGTRYSASDAERNVREGGRRANFVRLWRPYGYWILLILGGALTLASKHSGAIFVIGAHGWVGIAIIQKWIVGTRHASSDANNGRHPNRPFGRIGLLFICGVITLVLWVALSPALWSDPAARLGDLLKTRTELLDIQVAVDPVAPMSFDQRVIEIIRQPFVSPAQHFEVAFWGEIPEIQAEIAAYMASPLSGVQFGMIIGGALTLLTAVGVVIAIRKPLTVGLVIWFGVTALSLLANPLPWQRYYLPLIPPAILLASLGAVVILKFLLYTSRGGNELKVTPTN